MQLDGTVPARKVGRPALPRVDCVCLMCGNPFQIKRSDVARGRGLYCRPECYRVSQTGPRGPLADRVWPKVSKLGPVPEHCPERGPCWEWTAAIGRHGYGLISLDGDCELAHRVVYAMIVGPEERDILHHCDNRRCVHADPDPALSHLYPGTDLENQRDARDRGRAVKPPQPRAEQRARGERQGSAKLTVDEVREIRTMFSDGWTQTALAMEFGVDQTAISAIVLRKTWTHVQ